MATKYTPATIAKALSAFGVGTIGAAVAAAHGIDLSQLGFGEWLGAVGAGLTGAGAVFVTPNKSTEPEAPPVSPADQVITHLPQVVQEAQDKLAELEKVKDAVGTALGQLPVIGGEAQQVFDSIRLP